jgi:hypothetical protein
MTFYPIFLSVIFVVRNQSDSMEQLIAETTSLLADLVSDYELIVVDNASNDNSIALFKKLTAETGQPNLQIYALTKEVDLDVASWVGLENALGDFIVVIDPLVDGVHFLPTMLEEAVSGIDVVFANNQQKAAQSLAYRIAHTSFNKIYQLLNNVNLKEEAPRYRMMTRRIVNFILQHPQPAITYRHLPVTGGFSKRNLDYSSTPQTSQVSRLSDSINFGIRLLVSTTQAPMRIVTMLSLFGAIANLLYSTYVVIIAIIKKDIAPGWISLSLQQSGMFFLISLVLLILGEYILHMSHLANEGPLYHVAQEFTSAKMTRHEKLNIEESILKPANILE